MQAKLILTVVFVLFIVGCTDDTSTLSQQSIYPVKLFQVEHAQAGDIKQYSGRVSASNHSELSFRVSGELKSLLVKSGDEVKQGDIIARLDDRDAKTQLENTRSSFNLAKITYERMRISLEKQVITTAQFDQAEAEYLSAKARLSQAQDQLSYTVLRAPFDGVISRVPVETFQVVSSAQTIVNLQKPGSIDVLFQIPEQQVRQIARDRSESVRSNGKTIAWVMFSERPAKRYPATYKEHDSHTAPGSLSYEVTITLPEPEDITVLSGMSASVLLDYGVLVGESNRSWVVPTSALVTRADQPNKTIIWRYISSSESDVTSESIGRVEPVHVQAGAKLNNGILVQGELNAGDQIVVAGAQKMNEQRTVRPWVKEDGL